MTNNKYNGWVKTVSLAPPSLQDNTSDADRLAKALKKELKTDFIKIDLEILRQLPNLLRKWDFTVRCIVFKNHSQWILSRVCDPSDITQPAGIAVDLGTTRVVLRLINLLSGKMLAESSFDNPQIAIGYDILTRVHFADTDNGLEKLNKLIIGSINRKIEELCKTCKLKPEDVYLICIAGNTTMTHLLMGLDTHWIIREPYIPVINCPGLIKAGTLGIKVNSTAEVMIFPNIGSYFGGDLISGILFSGMNQSKETAILIDVGTNAEVVLGNSNWLIACAGAAGPALESGVTRMGMIAGPGVIDRVAVDPVTRKFQIHTIGNMPPKGICGSGLIDLAAQLFLSGLMDIRGKLVPETCGSKFLEKSGNARLLVIPAEQSATGKDLTISQADIDSLIQSKAAMYTILETITASVGMAPQDIKTFYIAGTFGLFINPVSAVSIGMLPDIPAESYKFLGNSSLDGATMVLNCCDCIDEIDAIRDRITYLELNVNQEFMNRFSAAKFIPHTDTRLFRQIKTNRKNN